MAEGEEGAEGIRPSSAFDEELDGVTPDNSDSDSIELPGNP